MGRYFRHRYSVSLSNSTAHLLVSPDDNFLQTDNVCLLRALLVLSVLHQYEAKSHARDVDDHACTHT